MPSGLAVMFDELGAGVFRRRYESLDLNIGVVLGEDGVLVVDTRATPGQAGELLEELRSLTPLPVRWVVNTHYHWDHTFGNARFPAAEIWGHERCRSTLLEEGEAMKQSAKRWLPGHLHPVVDEVEIVPPQQTFSDAVSLQIGRGVELSHHGRGHTDSDILIGVPDADVVFMGDLVEEGAPPSFGDAFPLSWPLTVRLAMAGPASVMVPGHGDVVDRPFVRAQHDELVAVAELCAACIEGSLQPDEAVLGGPYPPEVMRTAIGRAVAVASTERR